MIPAPFKVVLDANVLYPFSLRDTLLRAASAGLFQLYWSDQILEEARRSLVSSGRMSDDRATRLRSVMEEAFPEAIVTGHEPLIAAMKNDEKDKHVVAAAVKAGAQVIVTSNLKHFRELPEGIEAQSPDDFLCNLFDLDPDGVVELIREQATPSRSRSARSRSCSTVSENWSPDSWRQYERTRDRLSVTVPSPTTPRTELLLESPEWELLGRIEGFGMSVRLLERNAEELSRAIRYLTSDPRSCPLLSMREKRQRDSFLEEVLRLLHNFVASVKTVRDHAERMYSRLYEPNQSFPDYRLEIKRRFDSNPLSRFVEGLRNFFVHRRLPSVWYVTDRDGRRTLALRRSELLGYEKWTAPARAYVLASPEDVDIAFVVDEYMAAVRDFYWWFAEQQARIHAREYSVVQAALCAIAHAQAPEVRSGLGRAIEQVEASGLGLRDAVGRWLTPGDEDEFAVLIDDLPAWIDHALFRIVERHGPLPEALVERYRQAATVGKFSKA